MSTIQRDFSGAIKKTRAMLNIPRATKKQATTWTTETVRDLKRSAASMQKAGRGRKTGQLARGIGMQIGADEGKWNILLGTGIGGTKSVKYARIQDEGGTIRKKDKKLAIPLKGVKGKPSNFPDAFVIKSKAGNILIVQRKWKKVRGGENYRQSNQLIPLFVLKDEVTLPETRWFSGPLEKRIPILEQMMSPAEVLKCAESMAGGK